MGYTQQTDGDQVEGHSLSPAKQHTKSGQGLIMVGVALLLVGALAGLAWLVESRVIVLSASAVPAKEAPDIGSVAPNFRLHEVGSGNFVELASFRGKPVWVNFWATWCPPCRDEMPEMQKVYDEYKGQGLVLIGVDVQESAKQVTDFTNSLGVKWTFVVDSNGDVVHDYQVGGLPSHYFIGRDGVIKDIHVGGLQNMSGTMKIDLRDFIKKILR